MLLTNHPLPRKATKIPGEPKYWLYLPSDYNQAETKRWPLLLFLHGSGERGNKLEAVAVHGPPKLVAQGKQFPFLIVSPQCPHETWWDTEMLDSLLSDLTTHYRVDPKRIYCTGLSMGGFGTWKLALDYPNRFAAIAPICGGGLPYQAERIKKVPTWVFHGAKDSVVPFAKSQEMVDALKKAGGNVKFTLYPDADHDAWTRTYDNPEFYEWLLAQHR